MFARAKIFRSRPSVIRLEGSLGAAAAAAVCDHDGRQKGIPQPYDKTHTNAGVQL